MAIQRGDRAVTQVSKPAVSRVSKPAKRSNAPPIGKSATRQVWKPALRYGVASPQNLQQPAKIFWIIVTMKSMLSCVLTKSTAEALSVADEWEVAEQGSDAAQARLECNEKPKT